MTVPAPDRDLPIWLRPGAILFFIAAVTALRLVVAAATGLVRDEGYYALWSTAPAAGYLDHPPMVAWMIAAGRALLGESELAVRLLPTLSVALTSLAVYRTGALLFDLRVAGTAVVWFNVTLAAGLLFVATGDAPLVMFWALGVWAVAEFVARGNPSWWLAAGLFAGLGLLSKYTAGFLGLGLLLYLVASRERLGWLRLWQVWAGGAVALLVFLPNLMWNLERGWAGVAFQGKRLDGYGTSMGSMAGNLGELLAGQALGTGLALFVFVLIGAALFALRRTARDAAGLALPILTALPMAAFFIAYTWRFRVEANWMAPIWPMLALVGAWAAVRVRPARPVLGWPLRVLRGLQVPLGVVLVGIFYAQALWQPWPLPPSIDRTRDMRGWAGLEQEVAALVAMHGAGWVATSGDYGLTGQLATYGRFAGRTLPVRQVDAPERWDFLPPLEAALLAAPVVFVVGGAQDGTRALRHFGMAEPLGEVVRRQGDAVLERFSVFLVWAPLPETVAALTDG